MTSMHPQMSALLAAEHHETLRRLAAPRPSLWRPPWRRWRGRRGAVLAWTVPGHLALKT